MGDSLPEPPHLVYEEPVHCGGKTLEGVDKGTIGEELGWGT